MNNEIAKQRGARLKQAREKTGLTQVQVASKIGVSKSYYVHLEQGFNDLGKVRGSIKILLEKVLHIDVASLL